MTTSQHTVRADRVANFRTGRWIDRAEQAGIRFDFNWQTWALQISLPCDLAKEAEVTRFMAEIFGQSPEESRRRYVNLTDLVVRRLGKAKLMALHLGLDSEQDERPAA